MAYKGEQVVKSTGSNTNRMLTPDTIVPDPANPQTFNRYSYVRNNPINLIDPTGHCDESYGDRYEDYNCWNMNDSLVKMIESNQEYADAIGWNQELREKYEEYDFRGQISLKQMHRRKMNEPQACWGSGTGSGACNRAKFVEVTHIDEVRPDAFLIGTSASSGGFFSAILGGEVLFHLDGGSSEFAYSGFGTGVGQSIDATVPAYGGLVWNLEDLNDYEGDFWSLTVDWSVGQGVEFSVFGAPGAIPFINNGTWGIAGKPVSGFGASASYYETNYRPATDVVKDIWHEISSLLP